MGKQHVIELNGKRYDALTGKIITSKPAGNPTQTPQIIRTQMPTMDGIAKRRVSATPSKTPHRRPVEKSHTLMRKTVHKPVHHKVHAVATIVDKKPISEPTTDLKPRIKASKKSGIIRKFAPLTPHEQQPDNAQSNHLTDLRAKTTTLSQTVVSAASVVVNPLQQAIANATSHEQPKLKKPRLHKRLAQKLHVSPKIISSGAVVLAFVLLAGFFGYQNLPNLKMRLAASRAGVHGTLPAYQPAGFHINGISSKTGQIDIGYRSNSDTRNFTVTQTASSWNSDALREQLRTKGQTTNTVEVPDKGKTLFIYNDSSITWVDGGILYRVEGDSKLTSEQLLRLANSM